MNLSGNAVLVTGAGRGIGATTATLLARRGARVGVADVNGASASLTAEAIAREGGQALAISGDLATEAGFRAAAAAMAGHFGRIDAVVNNAMWIRYEPVEDVEDATMDRMLAIGVKAPVWGTQAVLRHREPGQPACVVNMASPAADQGYPRTSIYAAVKGAVIAMTRALAVELGPVGVRVNAVTPGAVPTPGARAIVDEAGYEMRKAKTPLRRLCSEEDVARAIAFLLSGEAAFVTGEVLHVDGGISVSAG